MPSSLHIDCTTHRNKKVLVLHFPYDAQRIARLKTRFPHARWSQTLRAWYLPDTPHYRTRLHLPPKSPFPEPPPILSAENKTAYQRYTQLLTLKAYSPNTQKVYAGEFLQFLQALRHHPAHSLTPERLRAYLLYCHKNLRLSENTLHSRLNALKFLPIHKRAFVAYR